MPDPARQLRTPPSRSPGRAVSRPAPGVLFALLALLLALAASPARAQEAAADSQIGGHGWTVIPAGPERRPTLLHLPPRSGPNAAPWGTVRLAAWLRDPPDRISGFGHRVFLLFPPEPGGPGGQQRRVLTISVTPVFRGVWENQPSDGLRTLPSLPGHGTLSGFAATPLGPAALLRGLPAEAEGSAGFHLLLLDRLDRTEWRLLTLPWQEPGRATAAPIGREVCHLLQMPDGLAILVDRGPTRPADLWTATLTRPTNPASSVQTVWRHEPVHWERTLGAEGAAPITEPTAQARSTSPELLAVDGHLIRYRYSADGDLLLETIRAGRGGGIMPPLRIAGVPPRSRVVPMPGAGAVAFLWPTEADGPLPTLPRGYEIREISAYSGRVLYEGDGHAGGLVASRQLQLLVALLLAIMVTVLLFILRPEGRGSATLPKDARPAEPSRRLAAAAADLMFGVLIAGWITGAPLGDIIGPGVFIGAQGAMPLVVALWVAFLQTTLSEWITGRSIGKALAGCEVISMAGSPPEQGDKPQQVEGGRGGWGQPPRFWQALARNGVRWAMPALGALLFADPLGRHPGDLLGRTAVVVRERREGDQGADERGGGGSENT